MPDFQIRRLRRSDLGRMRELNQVFATAFEDPKTYAKKPSSRYVGRLLGSKQLVVLAALVDGAVVGGLVAYVLEKLERERSEVYLYDLAVAQPFRRRGIARGLILALKKAAKRLGAYVIFVQADRPDRPAIALYTSMGVREEPLHFDIKVG